MSNNQGAATADDPMDMAEHESTYAAFVALTETVVAVLLCVLLALVLWGLEGHGFVALVGLILTFAGGGRRRADRPGLARSWRPSSCCSGSPASFFSRKSGSRRRRAIAKQSGDGVMLIGVVAETDPHETRVAASAETVKKFVALGAEAAVERGAGLGAGIPDADYAAAGAQARFRRRGARRRHRPESAPPERAPNSARSKRGALVVATMDPYGHLDAIDAMAKAGVSAFAMELMPRITRAQVMDVLSSQANLAGYRAVIDAAAEYGRALPMMMTPAGTVPAAKAFIMGVGVAGLQAIATARRLGAVVTATDVRPATKEQVESLGAKFVAVEDEEFKQAETAGGYAKEMSDAYKAKQAALIAAHIAKQDIVITTALIPGRPAPRLVTAEMVKSMRAGSVIVDLAVERGGNCELARAGEVVVTDNGVRIVGNSNVTRLAATASALYARNLYAFVETLIDKSTKTIAVNWDDELVKATCLTRDGAIVASEFSAEGGVNRRSGRGTQPARSCRKLP